MIDRVFIQRKVTLIEDELKNLLPYAKYTFDEVAKDPGKLAAVERFIERIVNRAIDINQHVIFEMAEKTIHTPLSYKGTFLALTDLEICPRDFGKEISKSAKLRNMLAHDYDEADKEEIYHSVEDAIRDYHQYCGHILEFLKKNQTEESLGAKK